MFFNFSSETPLAEFQLRPGQIQDLAAAIALNKSINESAPATGKTGPACVFAYYQWAKRGKKTWWVMPQSIMNQNREKMLKFTDFAPEDVAILESDHAALTKSWTGPIKERQQRISSLRVFIDDPRGTGLKRGLSHTEALKDYTLILRVELPGPIRPGEGQPTALNLDPEDHDPQTSVVGRYLLDPKGVPQKEKKLTRPVIVKDLIAASRAKVFITTFAFLREHWAHMLTIWPEIDLLMTDEHHLAFRDAGSAQTKAFFHVNKHCSQLYIMTGSLVAGRLDNVYPAIHAIEPRYYGSHNDFLNQHATFIDGYGRVLGWHGEDKVRAILDRHGVRHSFEDIYGDEPVAFFHEKIQVSPKCRESYDQFHEQAMLELENAEFLDGTQPGVAVIRARQILAHPETMGLAKGEITGKDERLAIFAAEGQKMILFSSLKPEQRRVYALLTGLGLKGGLINSDVDRAGRDKVDRAFKAGSLDFVVASGPTTAVGYDWEIADHVIYVSPDYQDDNFVQGYRRGSRGTRTTTLRVTSLEYEDTIERRQYQILTHKSQVANKVDPSRPVLNFTV